jgi:hypothetical protein
MAAMQPRNRRDEIQAKSMTGLHPAALELQEAPHD